MKKKIFSIIISAAILAGTAAGAFGGTYPESMGFLDFDEGSISAGKGSYTPTDPDYLFTVDGKKFILLDTDRAGNYFVMTEEHYGQQAFETSVQAHMVIEEAVEENGTYFFSIVNQPENEKWIFDPQNSSSVAHWLNNDFYENGNGEGTFLPEQIKSYIPEREWQIEGFKTYYGSGSRLFDRYFDSLGISGYIPSEIIASRIVKKPYSVRGKLALMSFTEYLKYQNIIGVNFSFSNWGGMMLRSQDAFLTTGDESLHTQLKYYFGPLQVVAPSRDTSVQLKVNIADAPNGAYYYIRPVFWLSKDFFTEVKCDVASIGRCPKKFVMDNSYDDLKRIYSDTEIEALGIIKPEGEAGKVSPSVAEVGFTGDAAAGKPLQGTYSYNKNSEESSPGLLEHLSGCQWYISDTVSGEKHPAPGGDRLEFTPGEEQTGKYIWFAVTPRNAFNNRGETVFSKKAVKIRENKNVTACFYDSGENPVTSIPADGTIKVSISYHLTEGESVNAYIAGYNSDRGLTGLSITTLSGEGMESATMMIESGGSCKVMVLGDARGAPYCIYEIND